MSEFNVNVADEAPLMTAPTGLRETPPSDLKATFRAFQRISSDSASLKEACTPTTTCDQLNV
jgi:hypothetical protein